MFTARPDVMLGGERLSHGEVGVTAQGAIQDYIASILPADSLSEPLARQLRVTVAPFSRPDVRPNGNATASILYGTLSRIATATS